MNFYSLLIDLILLLIIGVSVFFAARRGFVRTFIEAVGFLLAVILTLTICTPLASATYDKIIEPPILQMVSNKVDKVIEDKFEETPKFEMTDEEYEDFKSQMTGSVDDIIAKLPAFAKNYIKQSGLKPETVVSSADKIVNKGLTIENAAEKLAKDISQNKIKPLVCTVLSAIYSVIILMLSFIIVKILAIWLNKLFSFSVVGKLNATLGGVCGFVKGTAFALLCCSAIYMLIPLTQNGILFFTLENIDKTFIFKILISLI